MPTGNGTNNGGDGTKTYFEQQREMLVGEVAQNLEAVLQNINKLNRSLEGVIAVGNEFGSVEALWSQFENVMARDPNAAATETHEEGEQGADDTTVLQDEKP
ncbi:putative dash complex subunit dad1 protein [Neofusicoccum parvum]|uniref:DASH complex subunit DAD1 n=2 Tax=Neofusicoccum parvum TaxID=310453 RepID=R1GL63_BOTPV|nr:putative dash complex subunit dad1 protein [Neofusicoccum parvum UCRNP2]GME27237.1 putative dash complex subunit dad1 protein [Neofusicoccum parvum]GME57302.1 putative dash complex subunit dad1 protein [Neofusicoccum parvum]